MIPWWAWLVFAAGVWLIVTSIDRAVGLVLLRIHELRKEVEALAATVDRINDRVYYIASRTPNRRTDDLEELDWDSVLTDSSDELSGQPEDPDKPVRD